MRSLSTLRGGDEGESENLGKYSVDRDVGLHERNSRAVRHWCAQRSDSENEHSAVTVMVLIIMLQRWQWRCWDSSGNGSVEITMCTLVWQRWHLIVLWQRFQLPLLSQWLAHHCYTNMDIAVTALSVVTAVRVLSVSLLSQRCQLSPLPH